MFRHIPLGLVVSTVLTVMAQSNPAPRTVTDWFVPKLHFIYGFEHGDPVRVYFERTKAFDDAKLEIKGVSVPGVKVRSWRSLEAFSKPLFEVEFALKPGDDVDFDALRIQDAKGQEYAVRVGPNRVMYLKPKEQYEINFEVMEQLPNERLYLGMRVFNDSSQTVTIDRIVYAPKAAATNQILLNPAYDPAWFRKLEVWSQALVKGGGLLPPLPERAKYADAGKLNLKIAPSFGFSAAIVEPSLKPNYSCLRTPAAQKTDPAKRRDNAYLLGAIEYRVGSGPKQWYPLPDQIFADVCF